MNKSKRTGAPRARKVTERAPGITGPIGLFTPEQAAQLLNPDIVTASWIRELCRRREIEFTLMAGKYALTERQLAALVEKYTVPAGPAEPLVAEPRRRRPRETTTTAPTVTPLRARPPRRLRRASGDGCS